MIDPEIALIEALYAQADAAATNERSQINRLYAMGDLGLSKQLQSTQAGRSINSRPISEKTAIAHASAYVGQKLGESAIGLPAR